VAGLLRWLRSSLRGEVSATELLARRAAGAAAYSLFAAAEEDGSAPLYRVCAWNAFALQTIADTLLDVDSGDDPSTAGYVPRSTLAFVEACLALVPVWIEQATVARSDPAARAGAGLPAKLPRWLHDEPTRAVELHGLRVAYEAIEPRVESDLRAAGTAAAAEAKRLFAEMTTCFDYGCSLAARPSGPVDRGEARWRLLRALDHAVVLGQVLALPALGELVDFAARRDDGPLRRRATWLEIERGWPVVDRDGERVGMVVRVRGDRTTGAFEGLVVGGPFGSADVAVPAGSVAVIANGKVALSLLRRDIA
jgi:hypothetical protein